MIGRDRVFAIIYWLMGFFTPRKLRLVALVAGLLGCGLLPQARAEEPSITAVLDNSETVVGQPVQLQIKVSGARNATMPSEIAVDGLEIHYSGQSQLMEGRNFSFSYSVIYAYTIIPEKAGAFKIPSQVIKVGGTTLKTPELTLNVTDNGGRSPRGSRGGGVPDNSATDLGKNAFVELIVAKNSGYVGEMIPAEVRIGFNVRTPVESLGNGIDLTGQGFTTQKMREPRQTIETIRGKSYQVFTFKTAIAPARAGNIVIGPVQISPIVRMPQTLNRGRNGMRDPFSLNDPFFDNFFSDPAFAPGIPREIKLKSEPATLEVKALPPNAPPSFSGAVGNFAMTADAKPRTAQVGDPLTVTAKVSGRGNFDRVTAPEFDDEHGWHKYPSSAQFKQDDDVGISGAKTFETVLSANERKTQLPVSVFSFFDPVKEQYVTLRSQPISVRIEGGSLPAPTPSAATQTPAAKPSPSASSPPSVTAEKGPEILHQLTEIGRLRTFVPLSAQPAFWLLQLVPLAGLWALVGCEIRRRRLADRDALRKAQWDRELHDSLGRMRRTDTPPQEFITAGTRAVQLRAGILSGNEPNTFDAPRAAELLQLDAEGTARVQQLFANADEFRYSGGGNGIRTLSPDARREVMELIERLGK